MAAGTLSVKNNSKAVVGVGTTFTAFKAGDFLSLVVGQVPYTVAISSVESDTALTLVLPFDGPTATGLAWDGVKRDTMSLATMGVTVQAQKALRLMLADENNWRAIFGDEEEIAVTLPNGQVMQGMSWGYLSQLLKEVDPVEMRNLQQQAAASEAAAQGFRNEAEGFRNEAEGYKVQSLAILSDTQAVHDATNTIKTQTDKIKADTQAIKTQTNQIKTETGVIRDKANTAKTDAQAASAAAQGFRDQAKEWAQSVNADNLLTKTGNLAGLTDKSAARSNLGLGSVATENTVPIKKGGTAATTVAAARSNLGLGSVATENTVPIEKGGTAATTAAKARSNLGLGSVATENTVPIEKGGTAATTAAKARSNFGLGDNNKVKLGTLRLNGGESLVFNDVERNGLIISNASFGIDSWVGQTMHKWYTDWTRAGLVRAGDAHLSDYRVHVWKDGFTEALFRFLPDGRLISGNSGNPSVNEFQKAPLSDRDLKKEIKYTDGEESYNRVRQWLPAMFKYKESDVQRYGLIAQDLARIDPEYVHLLPGYAIYEDVKGVDEEGNEVVVDRKEIGYTDDVLSLDSNVLLMDLCAAFVHLLHKVEKLEGK
ncbi:putative tail tip protein [Escherichia phage JL1]|uniref:Tail tip protein n=1 Tax=Escherichia phage JL1 TaxID=2681620 RepID=K4PAP9_9CAUD|nr:tail fiber protein [Escherichia phage JL1]AFV51312.1 putative tail tip protein [Escherichia phage JL1]